MDKINLEPGRQKAPLSGEFYDLELRHEIGVAKSVDITPGSQILWRTLGLYKSIIKNEIH
jgi:hypothetical protein